MCADIGSIVGPLVAGLLADTVSYPVAFGVGAVLILAAAGYALRMPRGVGPPAPDADPPPDPDAHPDARQATAVEEGPR
jgi:dipeptide/tripeptide permease